MTKVIILGEEPKEIKKKEIEFVKAVRLVVGDDGTERANFSPSNFKYVELIHRAIHEENYDVMFAYDDNRIVGVIYLGHFNDGIV